MQYASLDQFIWFNVIFTADEWLLFHQDSPIAGGARGFNRATGFTKNSHLTALLRQENRILVTPS